MTLCSLKVSPILTDLSEEAGVKTFLFDSMDLELNFRIPVKACGNSQHGDALCPALDASPRTAHALKAKLTWGGYEDSSETLPGLYEGHNAALQRSRCTLGRRWMAHKTFNAEGAATGTKVHITFLEPKKILHDAPKLQMAALRPPPMDFEAPALLQQAAFLAPLADLERRLFCFL